MNASRTKRRGYALMIVVIFVTLFLALLGMQWRQTASLLRTETVRAFQTRRDRGCMLAAVQGIHYLEKCQVTSTPPTSPFPATIWNDGGTPTNFTVTLTLESTSGNTSIWKIVATPTPSQ